MTRILKVRPVRNQKDATAASLDLVVAATFQGEAPLSGSQMSVLDRNVISAARRAAERRGWKGTAGQCSVVSVGGKTPVTVVLRGLGKRRQLTRHELPKWLAQAARAAGTDGYRRALLVLPEHEAFSGIEAAILVLRELALTGYRFDELMQKARGSRLTEIRVVPPLGEEENYKSAHASATKIVGGIAAARDLANTPPNIATPDWMAQQARELAAGRDMQIEVLDLDELQKRGMGGLVAVGSGSANPPRLVKLEWGEGEETVSLVGKGVTFDTGGISIKPSANMDEMKFDKSGACTVFGIAQAAADLELPYRFRAFLSLAENMPGGRAYRPSDIVRCYNGKTVEILNTDAEGRMILADALAWAAEEKPDYLLDYATLTGACVVALGTHGAGLFTHDDDLAHDLIDAAGEADEYLWRLPLWPEFKEEMKGQHGDLKNAGVRWGGANTAAAFLSNFVKGSRRWAHVDIAGPAYIGRGDKQGFGATGYGVSLTALWLMRKAGRL